MALACAIPGAHRRESLLRDRHVLIPSGMVPHTMLEYGVFRQTPPRRITRSTISGCTLSTITRYERYPWLLLSRPPAAMPVGLAIRGTVRTMPSFSLTLTFVRHSPVGINRQRFDTIIISIIQQFFARLPIISTVYKTPNMATSIFPLGRCTTAERNLAGGRLGIPVSLIGSN